MNSEEYLKLFFIIALVLTPAITSTLLNQYTSTDWIYRHTQWISRYLHGDYTPVYEYPPLFHFFMLIPYKLNIEIYFQVIFSILSIFSILYYAYKSEGKEVMLSAGMMIAVSVAYMSFSGALMPQVFDYILFPLVILTYLNGKRILTTVGLLTIFFMHVTGLIFIGILLAHSWLTKRYKFSWIFLIMLLLLAIPSIFYLRENPAGWDWMAQAEWESFYTGWRFFLLSGILTWVYLPSAIWKFKVKNFKLTEKQLLYVIWTLAFIPLSLTGFGLWRMISYSIVPLSLLVASLLSDKK